MLLNSFSFFLLHFMRSSSYLNWISHWMIRASNSKVNFTYLHPSLITRRYELTSRRTRVAKPPFRFSKHWPGADGAWDRAIFFVKLGYRHRRHKCTLLLLPHPLDILIFFPLFIAFWCSHFFNGTATARRRRVSRASYRFYHHYATLRKSFSVSTKHLPGQCDIAHNDVNKN